MKEKIRFIMGNHKENHKMRKEAAVVVASFCFS